MENNNIYVIKIWSNVLLNNSWINEKIIKKVVQWVQKLREKWGKVVLVSSWAVAMWKKKIGTGFIK